MNRDQPARGPKSRTEPVPVIERRTGRAAGTRRPGWQEQAMTMLTLPGQGPAVVYAGQPMHILAGHRGQPPGLAAMQITVPPHFAGPVPHAHDGSDEAIYVLTGRLLVLAGAEPQEAPPGSMFVAPRGHRHGFSNPSGQAARVLGPWAPPEPALAFMRDIGAALSPETPPDPDRLREVYARHASRLLP